MRFAWKLETPEELQKFAADVVEWTVPKSPPFDDMGECMGLAIYTHIARKKDGTLVRVAYGRDDNEASVIDEWDEDDEEAVCPTASP